MIFKNTNEDVMTTKGEKLDMFSFDSIRLSSEIYSIEERINSFLSNIR